MSVPPGLGEGRRRPPTSGSGIENRNTRSTGEVFPVLELTNQFLLGPRARLQGVPLDLSILRRLTHRTVSIWRNPAACENFYHMFHARFLHLGPIIEEAFLEYEADYFLAFCIRCSTTTDALAIFTREACVLISESFDVRETLYAIFSWIYDNEVHVALTRFPRHWYDRADVRPADLPPSAPMLSRMFLCHTHVETLNGALILKDLMKDVMLPGRVSMKYTPSHTVKNDLIRRTSFATIIQRTRLPFGPLHTASTRVASFLAPGVIGQGRPGRVERDQITKDEQRAPQPLKTGFIPSVQPPVATFFAATTSKASFAPEQHRASVAVPEALPASRGRSGSSTAQSTFQSVPARQKTPTKVDWAGTSMLREEPQTETSTDQITYSKGLATDHGNTHGTGTTAGTTSTQAQSSPKISASPSQDQQASDTVKVERERAGPNESGICYSRMHNASGVTYPCHNGPRKPLRECTEKEIKSSTCIGDPNKYRADGSLIQLEGEVYPWGGVSTTNETNRRRRGQKMNLCCTCYCRSVPPTRQG